VWQPVQKITCCSICAQIFESEVALENHECPGEKEGNKVRGACFALVQWNRMDLRELVQLRISNTDQEPIGPKSPEKSKKSSGGVALILEVIRAVYFFTLDIYPDPGSSIPYTLSQIKFT
jgi:hypothetical protein